MDNDWIFTFCSTFYLTIKSLYNFLTLQEEKFPFVLSNLLNVSHKCILHSFLRFFSCIICIIISGIYPTEYISEFTGTADRTLKHCVWVSPEKRKRDLLTACTFYWTRSSDANNEAAASLSVCLPGRSSSWCTTNTPFILFRYTEVADWHVPAYECQHTHKQTGRIIWSGLGGGWCLLIPIVYRGTRFALVPSKVLIPLKRIHLQTTCPKQVTSQWMVLDIKNCGTSVAFLLTV